MRKIIKGHADRMPGDSELNPIGGTPVGVSEGQWPRCTYGAKGPMAHGMTSI